MEKVIVIPAKALVKSLSRGLGANLLARETSVGGAQGLTGAYQN